MCKFERKHRPITSLALPNKSIMLSVYTVLFSSNDSNIVVSLASPLISMISTADKGAKEWPETTYSPIENYAPVFSLSYLRNFENKIFTSLGVKFPRIMARFIVSSASGTLAPRPMLLRKQVVWSNQLLLGLSHSSS